MATPKSNPKRDARFAAARQQRQAQREQNKREHRPVGTIMRMTDPPMPLYLGEIESEHIEATINAIANQHSLIACARSIGCDPGNLLRAIERHAADDYAIARRIAAQAFDDAALETILAVEESDTPATISRAREAAAHYRWRCAKIAPRDYGDNKHVDIAVTQKPAVLDPASLTQDQREQLRLMLSAALAQRQALQDQSGRTIEHDDSPE